jgi:hypothetical protein
VRGLGSEGVDGGLQVVGIGLGSWWLGVVLESWWLGVVSSDGGEVVWVVEVHVEGE